MDQGEDQLVDAARDGLSAFGDEQPRAAPSSGAAMAGMVTFDHLYAAYIDRIYAYLKARVANRDDVADLTQQVFVQALAGLPSYRGTPDGLGAWIFRITRNVLADSHRHGRSSISLELAPEVTAMRAPDSVEAAAERLEIVRQVRALVTRLKPEEQELLALRFAAGLSSTEIAAVLGKSGASVKKRLTRLIRHLKEHYHELD